jgi:hypothetical protein
MTTMSYATTIAPGCNEELDQLREWRNAALSLHSPERGTFGQQCFECSSYAEPGVEVAWPCATFRALGGDVT